MVSSVLEKELHQQLEHLPFGQQRQVLDFARALAAAQPRGVAGAKLIAFAGAIEADDLRLMSQAIADDCEKVDANEW